MENLIELRQIIKIYEMGEEFENEHYRRQLRDSIVKLKKVHKSC